jgi:hypothetical protein
MEHSGMFSIKADIDAAERLLSDIGRKQLPFAMAMALNDTAASALKDVQLEINRAFVRPTRWTKNAFYVRRASKKRLSATIERKTPQSGKHYLEVQVKGGRRPQTGLEKLLVSRLKYDGIVGAVTPAKGARLNSFGNWSPAQRNQALSAVKAQRDATANTTKRSAARNKSRKGYFVPRPGSKLSPGIYARTGRNGRNVTKIVNILDAMPRYSKRFRFYEVANRSARIVFVRHFSRRLKQAMATAK